MEFSANQEEKAENTGARIGYHVVHSHVGAVRITMERIDSNAAAEGGQGEEDVSTFLKMEQ